MTNVQKKKETDIFFVRSTIREVPQLQLTLCPNHNCKFSLDNEGINKLESEIKKSKSSWILVRLKM